MHGQCTTIIQFKLSRAPHYNRGVVSSILTEELGVAFFATGLGLALHDYLFPSKYYDDEGLKLETSVISL